MPGLTEAPDVPRNKVEALGGGLWRPRLVIQQELAPLGLHTSEEAAQAAYDAAKLRAAMDLGRDLAAMKLHRPAAAYTAHPLWWRLLPGRCSFGEACSLLAHGLAAGLLAPACEAAGHLKAAEAAAAAAAQAELTGQPQRQQQGRSSAETPSPPGESNSSSQNHGTRQDGFGASEEGGAGTIHQFEPEIGRLACHGLQQTSLPSGRAHPPAAAASQASLQPASLAAGSEAVACSPAVGGTVGTGQSSQHAECAYWHESPVGSGQFAKSLPGSSIKTGYLRLSNWMVASAFPAIRATPQGCMRVQLAVEKNASPGRAAGSGIASELTLTWRTYKHKQGEHRTLILPRNLLRAQQLEAGDVVALHGGPSPSISFWPARSAQAQAFRQFEQYSIHLHIAVSIFGRAPGSERPPAEVTIMTGDGREHRWELGEFKGRECCYVRGTASMFRAVGGAAGDGIDFVPAGPGRAVAELVRAAAPDPLAPGSAALAGAEAAPPSALQPEQQHSAPVRSGGVPGVARTLAALPEVATVEADGDQLWMAIAATLGCLEAQGAPPASLRAYRVALMGMESDRWRLAHYGLLRAFVLRGEWQKAAAWMCQAATRLRG
ncbi:hypothetical protein ABPG77_004192 [Micractinium sp. CCAP 211/92]